MVSDLPSNVSGAWYSAAFSCVFQLRAIEMAMEQNDRERELIHRLGLWTLFPAKGDEG